MKELVNYLWNTPYQQLQTQFLMAILPLFILIAIWWFWTNKRR